MLLASTNARQDTTAKEESEPIEWKSTVPSSIFNYAGRNERSNVYRIETLNVTRMCIYLECITYYYHCIEIKPCATVIVLFHWRNSTDRCSFVGCKSSKKDAYVASRWSYPTCSSERSGFLYTELWYEWRMLFFSLIPYLSMIIRECISSSIDHIQWWSRFPTMSSRERCLCPYEKLLAVPHVYIQYACHLFVYRWILL